jgi:hypothetical protein
MRSARCSLRGLLDKDIGVEGWNLERRSGETALFALLLLRCLAFLVAKIMGHFRTQNPLVNPFG